MKPWDDGVWAAGLLVLLGLSLAGWQVFGRPARALGAGEQGQAWPQLSYVQIGPDFDQPLYLTHAGDGSGRLFVVEQSGRIWIIQNGALSDTPFLDLRDRVLSPYNGGGPEQGLLGLAFPPGYAQRGRFYVYYNDLKGDIRVSRFHVTANPDEINPGTEQLILFIDHPPEKNHNGGQLAFGQDGYLYLGTGDGGGGGDPHENAQNPDSLLGKVLRIQVEFPPGPSRPEQGLNVYLPLVAQNSIPELPPPTYSIPADNPFVGRPGYRGEIWALGLRNPWRFSFDRQTEDIFLADVGQHLYEEVNFQPTASGGGQNYGWNVMEGFSCYQSSSCDESAYTLPIHAYDHDLGCSVTGGYVYRGPAYPSMQGIYFYGDFCSGRLWGLRPDGQNWENQLLDETDYQISSFGEDEAGELYVIDHNGGVFQVTGQ